MLATAVTMPVVVTALPTSGEMCAAPWMSWIAVIVTSSLVIVPRPEPSAIAAVPVVLTRFDSWTVKVSFGSTTVSPLIATSMVWVSAPPAAKVSVPAVAI